MVFGNAQKYVSIAKQIINEITNNGSHNPNELLAKYSKEYNLNKNKQQRVVEEFNVNMFLSKLKDGTHQDSYVLMTPVIDETIKWNKIIEENNKKNQQRKDMTKTAFYNSDKKIVFDKSSMEYEHDPLLSGSFGNNNVVSAFEYNDVSELYKTAEYKQEQRDNQHIEELVKIAEYKGNEVLSEIARDLTKIANVSTGMAKTIVYDLVKEGHDDIASSVVENCKFKPREISSARMTDGIFEQDLPLLKSASPLIKEAGIGKLVIRMLKNGSSEHINNALNKIKKLASPRNRMAAYIAYVANKFRTDDTRGTLPGSFVKE